MPAAGKWASRLRISVNKEAPLGGSAIRVLPGTREIRMFVLGKKNIKNAMATRPSRGSSKPLFFFSAVCIIEWTICSRVKNLTNTKLPNQ